jgi:hypothetical protein
MFTAMILICMFDKSCIEFIDKEGPSLTQKECVDRVNEMLYDIKEFPLPPIKSMHYKCQPVSNGMKT